MYVYIYLFIDLHPLISTIFPTMSGDPGAKSRPRPFQTFWWFNITLIIFVYIHNASNLQLCWVMLSVRYTALTLPHPNDDVCSRSTMNGFTHFSEKFYRKKLFSEPNVFGGRRVKKHNTLGKSSRQERKGHIWKIHRGTHSIFW